MLETTLTIEDLIELLDYAGAGLEPVEVNRGSAYKELPYVYLSDGGSASLAITQYPSPEFAMAEASSRPFDLQEQQGVSLSWTGDPPTARTHLFVNGSLLVKYTGDDPEVLGLMVSAGGRLMAGGDYGAMAHGMPRITAYLESQGHEVTLPERAPNDLGIGLFDRRGETVLVNGQELHVFDLRPTRGSNHYLREVSADGYMLTDHRGEPVRMEWELPPRIYATEHVIAIYVGDDPDVIDGLRVLAGPPQRGVTDDEAYPFDRSWLAEQLEAVGADVLQTAAAVAEQPETALQLDVLRGFGERVITVNGEPVAVRVGTDMERPWWDEDTFLDGGFAHKAHLFTRENIAALYIGEDESVLTALMSVLGWSGLGQDKMIAMGLAGHLPRELAPVTSVEIRPSQQDPPAYTVVVSSEFGGCDGFYGAEVERNGTDIAITVSNYSTSEALAALSKETGNNYACLAILRGNTEYVFLGDDFEPGVEYTVTVNGEVEGTITGG